VKSVVGGRSGGFSKLEFRRTQNTDVELSAVHVLVYSSSAEFTSVPAVINASLAEHVQLVVGQHPGWPNLKKVIVR